MELPRVRVMVLVTRTHEEKVTEKIAYRTLYARPTDRKHSEIYQI